MLQVLLQVVIVVFHNVLFLLSHRDDGSAGTWDRVLLDRVISVIVAFPGC